MLFNSYIFILAFLPIVLGGFFLISKGSNRVAAIWLAVASLFFYGYWNPEFLLLLLGSVCFNYAAGYLIGHSRNLQQARTFLVVAIVVDLSLLGVFKYSNFVIDTVNSLGGNFAKVQIILPLGISFFTFTQIAFLVDVYRGLAREYSFVHYLLFATWFPHLIAGPVLHHRQMMPQFNHPETYKLNAESLAVGLTMFCLGLAKKVLVADQFALYANPIFDSAARGAAPSLIDAWVAALAYALQLYFDFSGYSDMAIGLSKMFNVKLPLNFDSPYKASSIIDFWRRWHMTLSQFLRDYLYIPLGGNRKGGVRRHVNILTTMLIGGLWHGAGWTFVFWGGLHGIYLLINHAWRWMIGGVDQKSDSDTVWGVLLTFVAVTVAWVPFRATTLSSAKSIWLGMLGLNGISLPETLQPHLPKLLIGHVHFTGFGASAVASVVWICIGIAIVWTLPNSQQWLANFNPASNKVSATTNIVWQPSVRYAMILGLLFSGCLLSLRRSSDFLYFQF